MTSSSTATNSAAAPSGSTKAICRRRCSACSASAPEEQQDQVRPHPRCLPLRRTAARWPRAWSRPHRHARRRRRQHPRSHRLPEEQQGQELMTDSPCTIDFKQLRELYIQSTCKEKKKDEGEPKASPILTPRSGDFHSPSSQRPILPQQLGETPPPPSLVLPRQFTACTPSSPPRSPRSARSARSSSAPPSIRSPHRRSPRPPRAAARNPRTPR